LDDDQDGEWVNVSSGTGSPGQTRAKGRNTVVVAVILSELYKAVRGTVPPKLTRRG